MPFLSKSQQRAMHAKASRGEIPKKTIHHWDEETKKMPGGFKSLPEKIEKKAFFSGFEKEAEKFRKKGKKHENLLARI